MGDFFNAKEVAEYLGINEKKVYYLAKAGKIPSTRVTGKWTFPKSLIDEWIEGSAAKPAGKARQEARPILLAAGSDDPSLGVIREIYAERTTPTSLFWATVGSSAGLMAIRDGVADLALAHLLDPATGEYNLPYLRKSMPQGAAAVRLFSREVGLVVRPGNPLGIKSTADLGRRGVRLINRQEGSGIRLYLDHELNGLGISGKKIAGYENTVTTHIEVGFRVLTGEADVGIATKAIIRMLGLEFISLTQEHFDMLIPRTQFSSRGIQTLLDIVGSKDYRRRVEALGGYEVSESGRVLTLS